MNRVARTFRWLSYLSMATAAGFAEFLPGGQGAPTFIVLAVVWFVAGATLQEVQRLITRSAAVVLKDIEDLKRVK